jgi:diketogulonate reductase-like aldo/keto reductase
MTSQIPQVTLNNGVQAQVVLRWLVQRGVVVIPK